MKYEFDIGQSALLMDMAMCINHYRLSTPGLFVCIHIPVQLDENTRIVPGVVAQVNSGKFKQCDVVDYKFFSGPPNFIFDVLTEDQIEEYAYRRDCFERSGVIEYVVWDHEKELPTWHRLEGGKYREVQSDETGLIKSTALPGMWISLDALKQRDWWVVMATISRGITRRGHSDFMNTIWKK